MKRFFFICLILISAEKGISKVEPPNYNFSLDMLDKFLPGKAYTAIEQDLGKGEIYKSKNDYITYKFYVAQYRYKFPVFVQVRGGKVVDFFAKLPSYFLHNVFHQTLITRIGKQDKYNKYEESAVYTWKNNSGNKHIYFGTCTITCFPVYYTVILRSEIGTSKYLPIIEQLSLVPKK